jgi:hypothetical protein
MFIKPESRALRALFWVFVVLVPGGFLLLALLGANVMHRRLQQESVALKDADAPPSLEAPEPGKSERPSHTGTTQAGTTQAAESESRVAA